MPREVVHTFSDIHVYSFLIGIVNRFCVFAFSVTGDHSNHIAHEDFVNLPVSTSTPARRTKTVETPCNVSDIASSQESQTCKHCYCIYKVDKIVYFARLLILVYNAQI